MEIGNRVSPNPVWNYIWSLSKRDPSINGTILAGAVSQHDVSKCPWWWIKWDNGEQTREAEDNLLRVIEF